MGVGKQSLIRRRDDPSLGHRDAFVVSTLGEDSLEIGFGSSAICALCGHK